MHTTMNCKRARGFTLIEMVIAVSIVTIIAALAYPSYTTYVQRTRRVDGKMALMDTAQRLERCRTRFGRYNSDDCDVELPMESSEKHYKISAVGAIGPSSFTLAAEPQGAQAYDTQCGILRLTSAGQQGSEDTNADTKGCW
jgi:type IV pilus assembly protein PilE